MNNTLAIVVLNYNGRGFLSRFLPDLVAHSDGHPVYVADSASTDDSLAFVRANFPTVRVIALPKNEGYAGGYNRALTYLRDQYGGATYYALVNSDLAVTPGWLTPLLELLEQNPRIAACQPKIRAYDNPMYFEHAGAAGGFMDWLGYVFCRGRIFPTLEPDNGQYDTDCRIFWATGACLLVRADVFHETGGFDAHFFAHMEEVDWCWRVQRQGYHVWASGQSVVYHVGGGTLPKANPHKTYLNYRNSLYMLYKNWPADGRLWPKIGLRLVLDGLSAILFVRAGQWPDVWAIVRAHISFYRQLPRLHRQRTALQKTQTQTVALYPYSVVWQYYGRKRHLFSRLPAINPKR